MNLTYSVATRRYVCSWQCVTVRPAAPSLYCTVHVYSADTTNGCSRPSPSIHWLDDDDTILAHSRYADGNYDSALNSSDLVGFNLPLVQSAYWSTVYRAKSNETILACHHLSHLIDLTI